ncbi:hypothetical protein PA7_15520 [Pseudonocardia asaccharolytica DSM 44247 = NBRC 16224]|uniref:Uncharacterized protein n=1 Tax=Pseudonocardia asaccharolytica DSM 44247 = NBRC 16224 TaxID=1123024 RepID=A0A511CYS8_9PSEU|nr:hypothetical protein PA7_15520 [Pseudonocardia asaccharolytica DSM 44247 = NBRC 16224]
MPASAVARGGVDVDDLPAQQPPHQVQMRGKIFPDPFAGRTEGVGVRAGPVGRHAHRDPARCELAQAGDLLVDPDAVESPRLGGFQERHRLRQRERFEPGLASGQPDPQPMAHSPARISSTCALSSSVL